MIRDFLQGTAIKTGFADVLETLREQTLKRVYGTSRSWATFHFYQ